jgi:hypothetical protein
VGSGVDGDVGVAGRVVGEPVLADSVGERAGQRRHAAVQGDAATSGGELFTYEAGDVVVGEVLEADRAQRGGEVLADVVGIAGHGCRFERSLLVLEPAGEVLRHGLTVVDVDGGPLAGHDAV